MSLLPPWRASVISTAGSVVTGYTNSIFSQNSFHLRHVSGQSPLSSGSLENDPCAQTEQGDAALIRVQQGIGNVLDRRRDLKAGRY